MQVGEKGPAIASGAGATDTDSEFECTWAKGIMKQLKKFWRPITKTPRIAHRAVIDTVVTATAGKNWVRPTSVGMTLDKIFSLCTCSPSVFISKRKGNEILAELMTNSIAWHVQPCSELLCEKRKASKPISFQLRQSLLAGFMDAINRLKFMAGPSFLPLHYSARIRTY